MPARRLFRSRTDVFIGGVCGGLAVYFDVDPVLVRLGAVLLTLAAPPAGLIGYLVCWVIVPEEPRTRPAASSVPPPPPPEPAGSPSPPHSATTGAPAGEPVTSREPEPEREMNPGRTGGAILVLIGAFLLLINLDIFHWHDLRFWRWRFFVPGILILLGLWMLVKAVGPEPDRGDRS